MTATDPRLPGGGIPHPNPPRIGSLFTGYGGLDQAVHQVLGGELAWVSDIDPGACAVLAHHHPDVPNLGDVSAIDWTAIEPVDVLCAGFPCQDISNAGRRAGIEGARSGLWSHVADAIGVLRPRLVYLENVSALVVRGLDRVLADLAALGFDAEWTTLRASDVGAAHRRERWFCLAWPSVARGVAKPAPDPDSLRRERSGGARDRGTGPADHGVAAADSDRGRLPQLPQRHGRPAGAAGTEQRGDAVGRVLDWREYEPAIHRWEAILGRPAPAPSITGRRGSSVLNPLFVEWLMGLPAGLVTSVPGLSRNQQLRLLGNGVVPSQGAEALRYLLTHLSAAAA